MGRLHCVKRRYCSLRAISLFSTVFLKVVFKDLYRRHVKDSACLKMFNSLPNDKILDQSKFKLLADNKINFYEK